VTRYCDIDVTDVNDNPPSFKEQIYYFNVSENAIAGFVVGYILADDPDQSKSIDRYLVLLSITVEF
jgi:hypothetical protein